MVFMFVCFAPRANPRYVAVSLYRLHTQKRQVQDLSFFGAEGGIRTRATVSHTTPLAGEPLEPLGYFCMAQFNSLLFKSYNTISHFFTLVKAFYRINEKYLGFFLHLSKNILSKYLTTLPFSFIINMYRKKIIFEVNKL